MGTFFIAGSAILVLVTFGWAVAGCKASAMGALAERRFAWRLHANYGAHRLDPIFETAADAGIWRRDNFGVDDPDSDCPVPLTLVAVVNGCMEAPTWRELSDAQFQMLGIGQL